MVGFTLRRLASLVVTLLVAGFVVYLMIYLSPGSPENTLFGGKQPSPEVRAAVRAHLGLDQPFLARFGHWLGDVVSGDLGVSLVSQQSVADRIAEPLAVTFALVLYAALLIVVIGLVLGLVSATNPGRVEGAVTAVVSLATAVPAFVAASVTISVFAVGLGWFSPFGLEPGLWGHVRSLTLPAVSLAVISSGLVARVTHAAAREQYVSDHVQTAVARGIGWRRVIGSHVLRNAARPVITAAGLQIAGLFAGAVVVEQAFGLGGLGQLLITSVQQKDFPVIQAISLVIVTAFVLTNLVADLAAAVADPRTRAGMAA
jgi:peptide/nickel transport system permease protein